MSICDNLKSSKSNVMYNEETDNLDFYINGEKKYSKYMGVQFDGFLIYNAGTRYVDLDYSSFSFDGYTIKTPEFTNSEIVFENTADNQMYIIGTYSPIDVTNYTKFCAHTNIGTITVDISELSGMYYPCFRTWKGKTNNVLNACLFSSKGSTNNPAKQAQLTVDGVYNHFVSKMWLE